VQGVVSIHDVTPATMDRVAGLLERVRPLTGTRVCLLVVPGLAWSPPELARLRRWAAEGMELAGHGWRHRGPPASLYHHLHGLVISRDQAEHLSRSRRELRALVRRGFGWFREVGLPAPELYVPPAWALGRLTRHDLAGLPYRWYEVQTGFIRADPHRHALAPLVGFEADTRTRQVALGLTNRVNLLLARATGRPLRIALHPDDLHLRLADHLHHVLERCADFLGTAEALRRIAGGGSAGAQSISGASPSSPDSARLRASER
jgi:hypothetical protein